VRKTIDGGRLAAALVVLSLSLAAAAPALAVTPVQTGDPGGGMTCVNCGPQHQSEQTSGSATGGSASNNPDGSGSQFDLSYDLPDDGQVYSGTLMTEVVNPDGSVSVQTWPTTWTSVGGSGYATAWNNAAIPIGGSGSISISATAGNGSSFNAGWVVKNFRK
jgi:hypothetical protein